MPAAVEAPGGDRLSGASAMGILPIGIGSQEPPLRRDVQPIPNQMRPNLVLAELPVRAA